LKIRGEGLVFYSQEEVTIALNEDKIDLHAIIKVKVDDIVDGKPVNHLIETTVGRVVFNKFVPEEVGFINELLTKKSLREIIGTVLKKSGTSATANFLDDIKRLGFKMAYDGGLSFNLGDVIIPESKKQLIKDANTEVEEVMNNYNMGFITFNERYNQIIDIWTHANSHLTQTLMKNYQPIIRVLILFS